MAATSSLYASGPTLSEIQAGVPTLSEIETKVDEGPGLSTAIASIQRGQNLNYYLNPLSVTISSVNTSKSFVSFLGETFSYDDVRDKQMVYLDSSTSLKIKATHMNNQSWNTWVSWEVIEYV